MRIEEIRNEVIHIIQDSSYDPDSVTGYINQALKYCAGVVDIPDLKRVFTVATIADQAYIPLGDYIDSYGGRVRMVKYDGSELTIYSALEHLLQNYDDLETEGDIEAVALEGRNLWYQYIPETPVNLLIVCYIYPEPLSRDEPIPEWMPEHLHYEILVNGAASYIWRQIEEEDSGQPTYARYFAAFRGGITNLREHIAKNRKSVGFSSWRY